MKRTILIAVLLVGRACGGWLNPSQPGFTADETLLRIAGDRTNAVALTDATNGLWQALAGTTTMVVTIWLGLLTRSATAFLALFCLK